MRLSRMKLAGLWERAMNKIANLDLRTLESNLSLLKQVVACVILGLALVGGTAVFAAVHPHHAMAAGCSSPNCGGQR
jgi:hypothetical protein